MKRLFSAPEILFVAFSEKFPVTFSVTAHIRGTISDDQLRGALVKVRQKHPFMAARVIPAVDGWWYDTDGVPDFPIRVVEGDWATVVADDLTRLFVNEVGPLIRFVLATSGDYTDLTIVCQHGISDGLSAAFLLRDILHYLGDPEAPVEPLSVVPPVDDLIPPYDPSQFDFSQPPPPQSPRESSGDAAGNVLYVWPWSLEQAQTEALVKRCRLEQTSVHAALSVAFLVAHDRLGLGAEGSEPHRHTVSSPVSLRQRLNVPVGERLGNYITSGIKTNLDCDIPTDFWEMAREVKASLSRDSGDESVFQQLAFMRELTLHVPIVELLKGEFPDPPVDYDLSISNLGNLNFPMNYGSLHLEAIYGPAVNALPKEKVVGVATTSGKLTFTLVTRIQVMDRPTAEKLKDITGELLSAAVGW